MIEVDVINLSDFFGEDVSEVVEKESEDVEITWFCMQLGDVVYIA